MMCFGICPPPPELGGFCIFWHTKKPTTYDFKVGPGKPVVNGVNYLYKNMAHLVPVKEPQTLISRKSMVIFEEWSLDGALFGSVSYNDPCQF